MFRYLTAALLALSSLAGGAAGAEPLTVATIERPPFMMRAPDGQLHGFSVDLWREIATRLDVRFDFVVETEFREMLRKVREGEVDLAVANISITAEREAAMDFSQPIFDSGLQIIVRHDALDFSVWGTIRDSGALEILGVGLVALLGLAHVMWLFERGRGEHIRHGYAAGVWDALWHVFVAFTVGGGDRPVSAVGRAVTMVWLLAGVLFVSSLTASITTFLTVSQLNSSIRSYRDLAGLRVGLPEGTTMARFAEARGLDFTPYPDLKETLAALEAGDIQATFADAPVMAYYVRGAGADVAALAGPVFAPDKIGAAMPTGSELRDQFNRALLEAIEDGAYQRIVARYFGETR